MKIGVVTIGQSPRPDVVGELSRILGKDHEFLEAGALDDYTLEDLKKVKTEPGEGVLVTRMRDGTEVKVTHGLVNPLIQKRITALEKKGVGLILLLCTGKFPNFKAKSLVVTPSEIVQGAIKASIRSGRMASVLPSIQQIGGKPHWRESDDLSTYLDSASPCGTMDEVEKLADRLDKQDLDLIVLNCMGFDHRMKERIKEKTGKPVIQSSSLIARFLQELVL